MLRMFKLKIMYIAQRILRIPRTRGFGVQSPTAYSILRSVINEQGFLKNNNFVDANSCSYPFEASRRERLIFRIRYRFHDLVQCSAISLQSIENYDSFFTNLSVGSVLVLLDIHEGAGARKVWRRILEDKRAVLSYDLLNCGVVFFDKTKIKQNFKVNY